MGLLERAESYLASKGLSPSDAGKVVGAFLAVKYSVLFLTFPFCYRFQPIRRILRPMRQTVALIKDDVKSKAKNFKRPLFMKKSLRDLKRADAGIEPSWGRRVLSYMENLADAAAKRKVWVKTAGLLNVEPKEFAMTLAEGIVLYKLSFLFLGPLTFFALVKLYQNPEKPGNIEKTAGEFIKDYRGQLVEVVVDESSNAVVRRISDVLKK